MNDLSPKLRSLSPVAIVAWTILAQVVLLAAFIARLDSRIMYLEETAANNRAQIESIGHEVRAINERIDRLDTPLARKLDNEIHRLDERENRFVQALDSLYSQFVEHLKNHKQ